MIGKSILHYKIIEKLGEGGMGVVYLAEDTKLKRKVAIKFLPKHISANSAEHKRFEIEAQAAAALNHPNIATIYSIEESADDIFIVMEYIPGKNLKEHLQDALLAVSEALDAAQQIARGLQEAHDHGILHRDIKSANIMRNDKGQVKIMDFGLAKLDTAAQLTREMSTLGTIGYMSPEQARGEKCDARSDIWALGVVLYEMLTGELPFKGDYDQAVIYNILNEAPASAAEQKIPQQLWVVINKALAKDPDERFQNAQEFLNDLTASVDSATGLTGAAKQKKAQAAASNKKFRLVLAVPGVIIIILAVVWFFNPFSSNDTTAKANIAGDTKASIAVLPFANISPDSENAFFADGVHEDVLNKLAGLKGLQVISRTSVMVFRDYEGDLKEVAERLHVRYLVEGTVSRWQDEIKVTATLIEAETNESKWSDSYNGKLQNVFQLQNQIAGHIVQSLETQINSAERRALNAIATENIAAYDNYLKARAILNLSWYSYEQLQQAIAYLNQAVTEDPAFVNAWSLLSISQSERYKRLSEAEKNQEAENAGGHAALALNKTRELQPDGVYDLKAGGYYQHLVKRKPLQALICFDRALEMLPNDAETMAYQAGIYFDLGQVENVVDVLEKAYVLDNQNGMISYMLTFAYEISHRYADIVPILKELLKREPEKTHYAVQASYFQFLADGSPASFKAFKESVNNVQVTEKYDSRSVLNKEMVVAMFNNDFDTYMQDWKGRWDRHYKGHGNWACPMIINDEANQAHLLLEHNKPLQAKEIIDKARDAITRPYQERAFCIFNKAAYSPKLDYMSGHIEKARRDLEKIIPEVLNNDAFPRGPVERGVLLETVDMVMPERVYEFYKQITAQKVSFTSIETVCANPWIYPNLIRDPDFVQEIRKDGRFVAFLEQHKLLQ